MKLCLVKNLQKQFIIIKIDKLTYSFNNLNITLFYNSVKLCFKFMYQ
jgi:hypothetical protein